MTTDHVNVAMSDMCSCAVYCLSAFPKLLNGQMVLKFSNVSIIYCLCSKNHKLAGGHRCSFYHC